MRKQQTAIVPPPRWLVQATLALAALLLIGFFSTEFSDTDSWWHLKTGEYIVTQHKLPDPDPFSFTTAAAPAAYQGEERTRHFNLTHEWLAQSIMYVTETAGGLGAVVLLKGLLMAAMGALVAAIARKRTGSWLWGLAAVCAMVPLASEFAHDRPAIVTYFFTVAFIAIFELEAPLWLLPMLSLIWANCHGGFFLGWVVCGAYAADAFLRKSAGFRRVALYGAAAVLVSGINPNGFGVVASLIDYRRSTMQSTLIEWSRSSLWGPPYSFDILLYAAALSLLLAWKRVRPADWLLFAAFAVAALMAFRNQMLIALLAPVVIAAYFPWKRALPAAAWWAAAALLAAGLVAGGSRGSLFQLRAAEWRFPSGAASFLREHNIRARVFNTYEYGGYLIWRGIPVFVDGRALSEKVFADYRVLVGSPPRNPERHRLLDRYGIGAILVNAFEYNSGAIYGMPLAMALPEASGWKLVYEDPQSLLFLRDVPAGMPVIERTRIADHLQAECELHISREPDLSLCARTLGDLFLRNGDAPRARRALQLYLDHPYRGIPDPDARRAYLGLVGQ